MRKTKPTPDSDPASAPDINIWLAGLGAWAHAQAEGNNVFEALVRDGLSLQRKTQTMAEASLSQATEQLAALTERAGNTRLDGLSSLFDTRVAKAADRLGLPDAATWQATQDRLTELEAQLRALTTAHAALVRQVAEAAGPDGPAPQLQAQSPTPSHKAKPKASASKPQLQLPLQAQAPRAKTAAPATGRAPAKASRKPASKRPPSRAR